jgi:hypothetical protein
MLLKANQKHEQEALQREALAEAKKKGLEKVNGIFQSGSGMVLRPTLQRQQSQHMSQSQEVNENLNAHSQQFKRQFAYFLSSGVHRGRARHSKDFEG